MAMTGETKIPGTQDERTADLPFLSVNFDRRSPLIKPEEGKTLLVLSKAAVGRNELWFG